MSERPGPPPEKTVPNVVREIRERVGSTGDPFADFNKGLGLREKKFQGIRRLVNKVTRKYKDEDPFAGKSREEQLHMQNVVDFTPNSTNEAGVERLQTNRNTWAKRIEDPDEQQRFTRHVDYARPQGLAPAPDPKMSEEVVDQLRTGERVRVPGSDQHLVIHSSNMPENIGPDTTVNVWTGLMANDNSDLTERDGVMGESHYRLIRLGELDEPLVGINLPQTGGSDPLTAEQKSDKYDDVFEGVADAYVNTLISKNIRNVNLLGYSIGGTLMATVAERIAKHNATAAEAETIKVKKIVLLEPPGVTKLTLPGISVRNMLEAKTLDRDHALPTDPDLVEASGLLLPDEKRAANKKAFNARFIKEVDPKFVYTRAITKATVEPRLETALRGLPDLEGVTIVTGSESKLSPEKAVAPMVGRLNALDGGKYAGKVNHVIKQGEGHFFDANAKALRDDVRRILTGSALPQPPTEPKPAEAA
jgi:pimeloyl-ACP methyl ester carboxylesterase